MKIKHLVNRLYPTTHPDAGITSIRERLVDNSFLVVVDNGSFIGILTPSDIVESPHQLVIDCLRQRPRLDSDQDIQATLTLMKESGDSVLPVFDGDKFVGVVTQTILLDYLSEYHSELKQAVAKSTAELAAANKHLQQEIEERQKAQEALREREGHYRRLVETAEEGIWIIGEDDKTIFVNHKMADMLGYAVDEIIGQSPFMFMDAKGKPNQEQTRHRQLIREQYESRFRRKDGTDLWAILTTNPIFDQEGQYLGALEMVTDITGRKEMEQKLKELQRAIEQSSEGIAIADLDGKFIFVNKNWAEMHGYQATELIGEPVSILNSPEDRKKLPKVWEEIKKKGFWQGELRRMRKDGSSFPAIITSSSVKDGNGKPIAIIRTCLDISERKESEEKLRETRNYLENLINYANAPIIVWNAEHRITRFNHAFERLTGKSADEVLGMSVEVLFPEDKRKEAMAHIDRTMAGERWDGVEIGVLGAEGTVKTILWNSAPLYAADGTTVFAAIAQGQDITRRKQMEEQLLKAQKLESVGILAGGIAHDFNNLLMGILGNIALAKLNQKLKPDVFRMLDNAEKAAFRSKGLTDQLLTFSRGGAPIKKTVSISGLLEDMASFALRGSKVRCEFSIPGDLWPVEVDEGQFGQVINNLVINAQQAMPGGGTIEVRAKNRIIGTEHAIPLKEGKYVEIAIKDHGVGIAKEHLPKIFDPYFSAKAKGRGLGLAVAYSIISKHAGYIGVESDPGVGTTFHVYLPASEKEPVFEESVDEPVRGTGRVLVMDDEEIVRSVAEELIRHIGYEVELARDGAEAIKLYQKAKKSGQRFDAVILDLTIPGGMGGQDTIKKLLEIDPEVRGIVSSGYSDDPVMANFSQYGFCGVIAKPYSVGELSRTLRQVIDTKKA